MAVQIVKAYGGARRVQARLAAEEQRVSPFVSLCLTTSASLVLWMLILRAAQLAWTSVS